MKTYIKIGIAITYILALLASASCGRINNNVEIKPVGVKEIITKELSAFDKITSWGMLKINIKNGDKYEVIIEADSAHIPYIITGVKNGELIVNLKNNVQLLTSDIKITIITPSIKEINCLGATEIKFEDIKTNTLSIDLSGSSTLKGKLECNELDIDLSGSSVLTLSGKSNKCDIDLSGASYFDAKNFETINLNFDGSGASVIDGILAKNSINADLSGSSVLIYKGEPKSINSDLSVASRIRKFENKK